jgi:serpin B
MGLLSMVVALSAISTGNGTSSYAPNVNDFTFALNRALVGKGTAQNELISGLSAEMALAMLQAGARGSSSEILLKTLGAQGGDSLLASNRNLAASLQSAKGAEFTLANSIWSLAGVQPSDQYRATLQHNFAAEFSALNGTGPEEVQTVNKWVNDHTKGRIPTIIDSLSPENRLFVINALTFDGKWKVPFNPDYTHPRSFALSSGSPVDVPAMTMVSERFPYAMAEDGTRALKLDYEGEEFATLMILPPKGVAATEAFRDMNAAKFKSIVGSVSDVKLRVQLPKLKMTAKYTIDGASSAAEQLGIAPLFSNIDLGMVAPELSHNTALSQIAQLTYLQWDEEGTKAAAVTGAMVSATAMPVNPPEFIADRPFLFFVFHQPTGTVIFSGLVNDPR